MQLNITNKNAWLSFDNFVQQFRTSTSLNQLTKSQTSLIIKILSNMGFIVDETKWVGIDKLELQK